PLLLFLEKFPYRVKFYTKPEAALGSFPRKELGEALRRGPKFREIAFYATDSPILRRLRRPLLGKEGFSSLSCSTGDIK
uniref:hypothetical protein n=1 Tax=Dialister succinatiphilus TaxID=487173 RepID=UPI00235415B4